MIRALGFPTLSPKAFLIPSSSSTRPSRAGLAERGWGCRFRAILPDPWAATLSRRGALTRGRASSFGFGSRRQAGPAAPSDWRRGRGRLPPDTDAPLLAGLRVLDTWPEHRCPAGYDSNVRPAIKRHPRPVHAKLSALDKISNFLLKSITYRIFTIRTMHGLCAQDMA